MPNRPLGKDVRSVQEHVIADSARDVNPDDIKIADLTTDQLRHLLACRIERERHAGPTIADEVRRLSEQADPETAAALSTMVDDLDSRVRRAVDSLREAAVDDDLAGVQVLRQLLSQGVDRDLAVAAIERHTGWTPRTLEERLTAVAVWALREGFSEAAVERALAAVAP
jgi:hypothetical protein